MAFQKGNPGGPGRPPRAAEDRLLDLVKSAVTQAELRKVMQTLARKAQEGDVPAARLLLSYLIGLPTDTATAERLSALENLAHELSHARQN